MRFISGSTTLNDVPLAATSLLGVSVESSGLDANIDWQQVASVTTQFDTDAVRQGRAVDPVNTVTRPITGTMTANWSVADLIVQSPGIPFPFEVGTIGLSSTGTCSLRFSGAPYECHLESSPSTIVDTYPFPGPYVNAKLVADITVTPQALATLRTATIGGAPAGTSNLSLSETGTTDPLTAACTSGVGDHLSYSLGTLSSTPGVQVQANLDLEVGASVDNPAYPTDPNPILYVPAVTPSFAFAAVDTTVPTSGTGITFDLGGVQEDDQTVTAVAGGPYAGSEGAPITFQGSGTTSGCGTPTLHWQFSDGGSADGAQVQHTFADNGTYTGTLTATKGAQTDSETFEIVVDNEAPAVDAGPETTAGVGAAVSFAGTATDPSSVDQGSLVYTWEFADGSPTGTATGTDVTHTFTLPGVYDVTLTVCDKDGGCSFDTRRVTVGSKQPTVLVNFSDIIGRNGSSSDFRALLIDKDLRPIVGRTVTFKLGTQTMTATTDARGIATTRATVTQRMGLYGVTATFTPGGTDAQQYKGSSMTLPFIVLPR